ncbi:uncharacterized protein ARMOST_21191 [Armillaria ostoyae]|uniref:CxC2-like cysteine cluster KDZ transposase-associated domain-containing protein n=1 Tax=Armillaria ostoyae TaxID=47428 RepID=A0A284S9E2_ARMOS|nr:uncharacterized protein ARMOST_21191 [Armillaria ostoyae]
MSKVSAYEFYHTLARVTDNSGMYTPPDRYQTFLRVVREWRHIHALKRFGHGHEPGGIEGTRPSLSGLPSAKHKLPPNWRDDISRHWLYQLFLGIDANFRLCRLNVSSNNADPGLNEGYAYFVEECAFRTHLDAFGKIIPEEEKSTCNNHDAVKLANSRGGQGSAAMGVGAIVCARHDMKRPLSVGDLQKGERYLNMDYFMLSTLTCDSPSDLVVLYDIACQWHKNFFKRNILYLVPKFHLPAHILLCRDNFSFNFSSKVGRTDGEAPECGWAATNALASSTKEMGPGSHRDTLDDHFGDYNWRKIIILPCLEHVTEFISYEEALKADHSASVESWRQMVLQWEQDRTQPNPFSPRLRPVTETAVCLEPAREEKSVSLVEIRHDRSKVQTQANRIGWKIEAWIDVQKVYMPRTTLLRVRDDDRCPAGTEVHPSKIPLYLPSAALKLNAVNPTTQITIIDDKQCLRLAQANDTLASLCDHLLLRSYLTVWHQRFNRGQRYGTKANTLFHQVETKIAADVAWYRRIYAALDTVDTLSTRSHLDFVIL